MPTFTTPEPISVTIELGVGDIRLAATERTDTTVEVRPSDPANKSDVTAAEQTRVEYANGMLTVKAPRGWRQYTPRGGAESIAVHIDLPSGSRVHAEGGVATLRTTGRLGDCYARSGVGDIQFDETANLEVKTGQGDIGLGRSVGRVDVTTGSGSLRLGDIDGSAGVKNSNGETWIGAVAGDLRISAANGRITIGRVQATVSAKTANGDVIVDEVAGGAVVAQSAFGDIEVGVVDGVAAWLELNTKFGNVRNGLDASEAPEPGAARAEVRARTSYGDITVRRTFADHSPQR
ncbi:MAG TPA: DUF4097 family beta strand repeat-containing protein [Acidimicrobiales bacterium]|jgi:hypothetical protein|nr:DUF4097 family beta strand repeat-containing protein [Acidimicrobiales bacterium]